MKIDELVRDHYVDLGDIDRDIWRYISIHRYEAANSTLVDLAAKCNATKSAVLRFAQRLGFRGFSEFKYALKAEVEADARDIVDAAVLDRYTAIVLKSLKDFLSRDFTPVFRLIEQSSKVFLYGTGTLQRAVAQEMRRVFLAGDEYFYVVEGVDETAALTGALTQDDLLFVFSLKGQSDNATTLARNLKARNVPFIAVTSYLDNDIAHLADESILVGTESLPIGSGHSYEVLDAYFLLVSILFLKYSEYKRSHR